MNKYIIPMCMLLFCACPPNSTKFENHNTKNDPSDDMDIVCYSGGVEIKRVTVDLTKNRVYSDTFEAYLNGRYVGTFSHSMCVTHEVGK